MEPVFLFCIGRWVLYPLSHLGMEGDAIGAVGPLGMSLHLSRAFSPFHQHSTAGQVPQPVLGILEGSKPMGGCQP